MNSRVLFVGACVVACGAELVCAGSVSRVGGFSLNLGSVPVDVAYDPAMNQFFVAGGFTRDIDVLSDLGNPITSHPMPPAVSSTNEVGLDFAPPGAGGVNVGGNVVADDTLFVLNGDLPNDTIFALNKTTGAQLSDVQLTLTQSVGLAYHAARGTFFIVTIDDMVHEINGTDGSLINSFALPGYDVMAGDVAVNPFSGNLFIVGINTGTNDIIREVTPTGVLVMDYDAGGLVQNNGQPPSNTGLSGISFNPFNGHVYVTNSVNPGGLGFFVTEIDLGLPVPEPMSAAMLALGGLAMVRRRR